MTTKSIAFIVGLLILVGVGGYIVSQKQPNNTYTITNPVSDQTGAQTTDTTTADTTTGGTTSGGYTMSDVAAHNSASSCWSVIDGAVYDLTSWISQHPGGDQGILAICGIDGTAAFHGQHGDNKKQATILATFKIGTLAQ